MSKVCSHFIMYSLQRINSFLSNFFQVGQVKTNIIQINQIEIELLCIFFLKDYMRIFTCVPLHTELVKPRQFEVKCKKDDTTTETSIQSDVHRRLIDVFTGNP